MHFRQFYGKERIFGKPVYCLRIADTPQNLFKFVLAKKYITEIEIITPMYLNFFVWILQKTYFHS